MKGKNYIVSLLIFVTMINCKGVNNAFEVTVYETSANKNALTKVNQFSTSENKAKITINPAQKFPKITGF